MKPCDLQFDLRKNPDSSRVHGLRIAVSAPSNAEQKEFHNGEETPPGNGNASTGAAGEKGQASGRLLSVADVATLLHVPVSWVYGRMRKRSLERLPAYRLGKYWRFREDEIYAWIANRRGGHHAA